ncbi:MAG: aminotransferase class I/II-fold pyridoxal phosphate-dependent enzyme [Bacteroidales bacterium]|nr:aminotransferase class I/II-fold pyridoxal phosphate-dependent enzyme [Bacteroidales bacterium]
MRQLSKSKLNLGDDALDFIDLYLSLKPKAENLLPAHFVGMLKNFYQLCYQEPDDPVYQQKEISRRLLELKEAFPAYVDVSLMLFPHEESKAFQYRSRLNKFRNRLVHLMDTELINDDQQEEARQVLQFHDFSMGTPPFTQGNIQFRSNILLGEEAVVLRRFREILGISEDVEKSQWNYLMDVLEQMVGQSAHYTTANEKTDFLERMSQSVHLKGLNGFIKTVVSGSPDTAINLIRDELFHSSQVIELPFNTADTLFQKIQENKTAVFVIKVQSLIHNPFTDHRWFPFLSRMIFVDDTPMALRTNTCLVFSFHNKIIQTLNKVHTKKLGALANSQLNLRLILEKVSLKNLNQFRERVSAKIEDYETELTEIKTEQLGSADDPAKNLSLFKFDEFYRQLIKDKYTLEKLNSYLDLIIRSADPSEQKKLNMALMDAFEERTLKYFYSGTKKIHIATVVEGGGRNQIKTYGEFLLQRKLMPVKKEITERCRVILDVFPDTYQRTLKNHFHKNFGINLFLEKYKQHIIKAENEADNTGRLKNMLIDLGILDKYNTLSEKEKNIIQEFISNLTNLKKTSISDDVQMIIRDVLFGKEDKVLKPYILFNKYASWEYLDLFPTDRFDINPFDLEIGMTEEGRIDFERLTDRLERMKNTFQIFDETGSLWDRFSENLTIVINDPSNPFGYSDFNNEAMLEFLKFISTSKITLFLDEAYNDTVKIENDAEPKWRTISRYVMNNLDQKYNRLNLVSSISTTKNLGATGDRLGSLVATPSKKEVIDFARKRNNRESGNTNSLYMLVNILQTAQLAKSIKNILEEKQARNASRHKFKEIIEQYIMDTCRAQLVNREKKKTNEIPLSFEGSPLHLFLLNELEALDKLDMLELPDDFKYKGEPFFAYYQKQLVSSLNGFRVNKNFRNESLTRLNIAKETAAELLSGEAGEHARLVASDGSFLFNIQLKHFFSYQDLEKFAQKLTEERGVAVIPYQNGFLRFSLGGYLDGSTASYDVFGKEVKNALEIVLKYWQRFYEAKNNEKNKGRTTDELLKEIFSLPSEQAFIDQLLEDFYLIRKLKKKGFKSLNIDNQWTLYHAPPQLSGVSIHTIDNSTNAVIEFSSEVGRCSTLDEFIQSAAFTSLYENLLPQVYQRIPSIKHLPFGEVLARYGKSELLKFITNKLGYEPNAYVLDGPDEDIIMTEILMEMERLLFSPGKTKILALKSSGDHRADVARMEGVNQMLRKFIKELLLHFNLPFDHDPSAPSLHELISKTAEEFVEVIGVDMENLDVERAVNVFGEKLYSQFDQQALDLGKKLFGDITQKIRQRVFNSETSAVERIVYLYLLTENSDFNKNLNHILSGINKALKALDDAEAEGFIGDFLYKNLPEQWNLIWEEVTNAAKRKVKTTEVHSEIRRFVLFLIRLLNNTKANEHYYPYVHTVMKRSEVHFLRQNSAINEMIQHGISVYEHFDTKKHVLSQSENGSLQWIPNLLSECGVIGTEQNVQTHTRIATDSKKREFPFHRLDRVENSLKKGKPTSGAPNEYIKVLDTRPMPSFFLNRLESYVSRMDSGDFRCKIFNGGLVNELFVFHKSYMKYMADNFRLMEKQETSMEDILNFVPDTICFYGLPEKLISFPQIGYFDVPGPKGNIKTIITPLRKEVDYFGDIKKPRLTVMNEKIKEMGGIPVHGSLFAVEEDDGAVFVVQIAGDSGVGKSEMLAAMMLKWMKQNLTGVRSLKMIAGDMLHVFPDKDGNLYGIGTEEGDFSRVTDFDPEYIKYYYTLFESASDSNVEDLNSRSTISGLCDVTMPYKIDIMLTASNYAREEAGITRYENPENFILYRNSHGERKEKATSGDNPNFQRTLQRYSGDKNIVEVLDRHGAYIDEVLDWEFDDYNRKFYLCSSYKMMELINLEEIVNKIFSEKKFTEDGVEWSIEKVDFDIIKNRFVALLKGEEEEKQQIIDRSLFNTLFDSLASTPAGQPFVAEEGEFESKKHLINFLKTSAAKKIQLGILSTDLGRKGKEITGPQIAAEDMRKLIREVRNARPDINENKNRIKNLVQETYAASLNSFGSNAETDRYNFWLWQMEQMQKAELVRIDNPEEVIDLSKMKRKIAPERPFQPLLVTPNLNREISGMSETFEQLLHLPHMEQLTHVFDNYASLVFVADNYSQETVVNNIILQLLLMNRAILSEDLTKGQLMEKVDKETLAAAKHVALKIFMKKK